MGARGSDNNSSKRVGLCEVSSLWPNICDRTSRPRNTREAAYPSHCFRQMRVARMERLKLTHLGIFSVGRVTQFAGRTETPPLLGPHAGCHEQPIRSHATYGEGVKSDPGLSQHWNFSKLRELSACPSAFSKRRNRTYATCGLNKSQRQ